MDTGVPLPQEPNKVVAHVKAWWPAHAAIVTAVGTALLPVAQQAIAAHPAVAAAISAVSVILAKLSKSPLQS